MIRCALVLSRCTGFGGISRPFAGQRPNLTTSDDIPTTLKAFAGSRPELARRVERAKILLGYEAGKNVSALARELGTNRSKAERCADKGLHGVWLAALA